MNEAMRVLEQVEILLHTLPDGADAAVLDDDLLLSVATRVEAVGRRIDALRVTTAAAVADRSRYELGDAGLARRHGCTHPVHLLERLCRVSSAEARRRIRVGSALAPRTTLSGQRLPALYPQVAAAVASGSCGIESAAHIIRSLGEAAPRCDVVDLSAAETSLVDAASVEPADSIGDQARLWRDHLDTDGAEPRADRQHAARTFTLGRERDDGMTPFSGLADPLSAGTLRAAFSAYRRKPVMTESVPTSGDADADADAADEAPIGDDRTFTQREFDTLMGLIVAGLGADSTITPGGRASVVATVRLDDLDRGVGSGWLDAVRDSIPVSAIDRLVCDAGMEIAITGRNGALTALTAPTPMFTRRQRRALAARDGGCVWPGCPAPAQWCDAHHVVERERGGPTDVSNGVLLCPAHHRLLHHSSHSMKMIRGRPHLLAPPSIDPHQRWSRLGKARSELLAAVESGGAELPVSGSARDPNRRMRA